MTFDSAMEAALDGDSILFLGAGFSFGATNSRMEAFEGGAAFAKRLGSDVGLPAEADLLEASETFLDRRGPAALAKAVLEGFRATEVARHHTSIASLPWRRVYTTNYDNVFEFASGKSKRPCRPVTLSEAPGDFDQNESLCVHFNGYVERVTSSIGDELRLNDGSYITASVEASPWAAVFRLDLSMARSVFFVGYSLVDLDIARILASTDSLQEKTFFVVGPSPSRQTENRAVRYGTIQRFDAAWFGKQIETKRVKYSPRENTAPLWFSVEPYERRLTDTTAVSDRAVFDLFLRGIVDKQLAWNSVHGSVQPYLARRGCVADVMRALNDPAKIIIIHGSLGNGKSILVEIAAGMAFAAGKAVYRLSKRSPTMASELSYLCSLDNPSVLIVDSYPGWLDALSVISKFRNEKVSLLLTARTGPNDILIDRIEELFSERTVQEVDAGRMQDGDLESVNEIFEKYGLWGEKAALTRQSRLNHLTVRCKGEWQSVLVDLFRAPQIESRFAGILKTLDSKAGYYDILLGILALTILSQRVTLDTLVDIFGHRVLDSAFQRNERVAEFVDFRRGEVTNRSSVAAQFVLSRVADPNAIVDVLAKMASALDKISTSYRLYNETLRSLLQFSQVETILPNRSILERRNAAFKYYEQVKNLAYCQTNPQFWLQYAIAALVFEDFERADRYFSSAYSLAKRQNSYDTHKIDNHYARLLLEKACRSGSKESALRLFRDARKIIFEQIQTEKLYYPYRVANGIGEFYDTFLGVLSPPEQEEVLNSARYVIKRIEGLSEQLRGQRYVVECLATMNRMTVIAR